MSDAGLGIDIGEHGGKIAGGAAGAATIITAWLGRFFRARDERAREDAAAKRELELQVLLAKIQSDLTHALRVLESQSKMGERIAVLEHMAGEHRSLGDRLVLVESKAVAAHSRGDDFNRRLDRLEARD
jgi:hypothetical protein